MKNSALSRLLRIPGACRSLLIPGNHRSLVPPENLFGRLRVENEAGEFCDQKNMVVYGGADVLARLLAGQNNYRIQHFYLEFQNIAGSPTPLAVSRANNAATVKSYLTTDKDLLRAPLAATPLISASSGTYAGNQATFYALSTATTGLLNGLGFGPGTNSKVMALCLVAAPTGAHADDIVYARAVLGTPVAAVGAGTISASWIAGAL